MVCSLLSSLSLFVVNLVDCQRLLDFLQDSVIKCTLDIVVGGPRPLDLMVGSALLDRLARRAF